MRIKDILKNQKEERPKEAKSPLEGRVLSFGSYKKHPEDHTYKNSIDFYINKPKEKTEVYQ